MTTFQQLNLGWNADPNAPDPKVVIEGGDVIVLFRMNSFQFPEFTSKDMGSLRFKNCWRYRLGDTNDEGWFRGQCRFSGIAPGWGEFYEIKGDLRLTECPDDWIRLSPKPDNSRNFLFYFKDETFESSASGWSFDVV